MKALVSIIIPLYNAEKYFRDTLDSVLNQTYIIWECIIIDDGSTDSSKEVALEYCKKDKRFKYYYQENAGASSARNKAVGISTGEYIQYLDADDIILPDKLRIMLEKYSSLQDNEILYCDMISGKHSNIHQSLPIRFSLNLGHAVTFDETYRKYAIDFAITPVCFLFPRKVVLIAEWNTELGPGEDWDYFLQILNKNYIFIFLPEILAVYRNTPDSYSKNLTKSFRSHHKVLVYWAKKKNQNLFFFSKRCALLYKRNIFLYLLNKTDKIIHPDVGFDNISFKLYIYILLIYPFTFYYLLSETIRIIKKNI